MTLLKVQILNLLGLLLYDMVLDYFPIIFLCITPYRLCLMSIPSSFTPWVLMHVVPSALTILFLSLSLFLFFSGLMLSNQSSSITLWMNAPFSLPPMAYLGRGKNYFLCVLTTPGIYFYYRTYHILLL